MKPDARRAIAVELDAVTVQGYIDGIEAMLAGIEENLRGVVVADATARELQASASLLRRSMATWSARPPDAEVLADLIESVTDVFEKSKAVRRAERTRIG